MSLHTFQHRVLTAVFGWERKFAPKCKDYIFYLPSTCYPSGRRPLSTRNDIVFGALQQDDMMGRLMRGGHNPASMDAHVIDDHDVCLADCVQDVGHTLYYEHNLICPLLLQLKVLAVNHDAAQAYSSCEASQAVELSGGSGFDPPEHALTEVNEDDEIYGIKACNLAVGWLQSNSIHPSYKREAQRLLGLDRSSDALFDPEAFDVQRARRRLASALQHSTARTHCPVTTGQALAGLFSGGSRIQSQIPPGGSTMGMCKWCHKDNCPLLRCAACKDVSYCTRECQRKDWKVHKVLCVKVTKPAGKT